MELQDRKVSEPGLLHSKPSLHSLCEPASVQSPKDAGTKETITELYSRMISEPWSCHIARFTGDIWPAQRVSWEESRRTDVASGRPPWDMRKLLVKYSVACFSFCLQSWLSVWIFTVSGVAVTVTYSCKTVLHISALDPGFGRSKYCFLINHFKLPLKESNC